MPTIGPSECSSLRTQKPTPLYPMIHTQAPPMSRTIHMLTLPLLGHMYLVVHMVAVATSTLTINSAFSMIITSRRTRIPKHSVRNLISCDDPLRKSARPEKYSSQASASKQKGTPHFE